MEQFRVTFFPAVTLTVFLQLSDTAERKEVFDEFLLPLERSCLLVTYLVQEV